MTQAKLLSPAVFLCMAIVVSGCSESFKEKQKQDAAAQDVLRRISESEKAEKAPQTEDKVNEKAFMVGYRSYKMGMVEIARKQFSETCDKGHMKSCTMFASMLDEGVGGPVDREKARALHIKTCDGGIHQSCYNGGAMMFNGEGGPLNKAQARTMYEKGCKLGDEDSCTDLKKLSF
ncbi:MAG: tetratricopeptide repeat protein [Sphingorhabdus sp.]